MDRKIIQDCIDYIEENLKAEISAEELSARAGFSYYYFCHLFQSGVGMPVKQYICRRRLLHAICEIAEGSRMVDAALAYGFSTYSGFYRSFLREFGYTPSLFLENCKVTKPYPVNLLEESIMISRKKASELLTNWGLEEQPVSDIVLESIGKISETAKYVGTEYVLKYTANLGSLKKNINLCKALGQAGLVAASVVPLTDGREYLETDGLYFYVMTRIQGKPMTAAAMYQEGGSEKAAILGTSIGQLSLALAQIDVPGDDRDVCRSVTETAIPKLQGKLEVDPAFLRAYAERFSTLYPQLPKQIIHRDPNPGNVIQMDGKYGFIDFDLSERSVRIYDPCYAATAILSESFEEQNGERMEAWIRIYRGIMTAYDRMVTLSAEEKEAVPYILLANQLICTAWFGDYEKFASLYETNRRMTEWVIRNFESLKL